MRNHLRCGLVRIIFAGRHVTNQDGMRHVRDRLLRMESAGERPVLAGTACSPNSPIAALGQLRDHSEGQLPSAAANWCSRPKADVRPRLPVSSHHLSHAEHSTRCVPLQIAVCAACAGSAGVGNLPDRDRQLAQTRRAGALLVLCRLDRLVGSAHACLCRCARSVWPARPSF